MEASKIVINEDTYEVKDYKLRSDSTTKKNKLESQVAEAEGIRTEVEGGKKAIADAITSKGVVTEPDAAFQEMADNVLDIEVELGYTPPAAAYILDLAIPDYRYICEYPYRKYTVARETNSNYTTMISVEMPTKNDYSVATVISRVKRLNEDWTGVPVFECRAALQFKSNTELYYQCDRRMEGESPVYTTVVYTITIPDMGNYDEVVINFTEHRATVDITISIAPVVDGRIQEFTEVLSHHYKTFYWNMVNNAVNDKATNWLTVRGSQIEVAPSAVNCKDMAVIKDGEILVGNTSLYPFPEGFTIE